MLAQLPKVDVQALSEGKLLVAQDIRLLPMHETRGQSFKLMPMSASAEASFFEDFNGLLAALGSSWSEFVGILSVITFVDVASMPGLPYFSGSSNITFGAMHMIQSRKTPILAECITHEAAHTWLGLLDSNDRFARGMWNEAAPCISPWREDPRPIGGVVHGVFVFSCVLVVLVSLIDRLSDPEEVETTRKRIARITAQVEEGLATLRISGLLTEAGEQLCADSQARLESSLAVAGDQLEEARHVARSSYLRKKAADLTDKVHLYV
jgi:hypothetical protein